jgi:hypothetical protein
MEIAGADVAVTVAVAVLAARAGRDPRATAASARMTRYCFLMVFASVS